MKRNIMMLPFLLLAMMMWAAPEGDTGDFPGDPGTVIADLDVHAMVIDGDSIASYAPTGVGSYEAGTTVTITAQTIPGYKFAYWSDGVTDNPRTLVLTRTTSLDAMYNRSQIEIAVAANQWTFVCLPPLGDRQYTEDMFTYDGLTNVQWGTYNGSKRADGKSGWETPETFNALQGYILYSATAGTLRINAYEDEIRQGESGSSIYAGLIAYASSHPENESWNFLGNPYYQGFSIAGFAAAGIESPITVWNGTAYSTYTPGIDEYSLQPFEAFFIQKAEGGAESITFNPEYVVEPYIPIEGELSGAFSVSDSTKIHFSKGNLQYRASTDTWRFAENQYDTIGSANANISSTYDGWIDLFGWGTGNNPTLTSGDASDYSTFVDWGTNSISNGGNKANLWRTLTMAEWNYLFYTRTNASGLYGSAILDSISYGIIVLPDNWQSDTGQRIMGGLMFYSGFFATNRFTIEQWNELESAGAVFLPVSGSLGTSKSMCNVGMGGGMGGMDVGMSADVGEPGMYISGNAANWLATPYGEDDAYSYSFCGLGIILQENKRFCGLSVRLVR